LALQSSLPDSDESAFSSAKNLVEQLIRALQSKACLSASHGEVEHTIQKEGMEVLRLLFQGHLDRRFLSEPSLPSVVQAGHVERTYKREATSRSLHSLFGTVHVRRKGYSAGGVDSVFPLDGQLNLSKDCYSDGLRRQATELVSDLSFDKSTAHIQKGSASLFPKRQMEIAAQHVSLDFDAFYQTRQVSDSSESTDFLVLTCDGKGVVMRKEGLREATRKSAEGATHKKQTRLSKGEKRNRKRMATVAAVYDVAPHQRTPESILGETERKGEPPKPQNKRVWASVEKPSLEVIEAMFEEAQRRDPEQKRKWVILVDGQLTQLQEIQRVQKKRGIRAEVVVDFVHVLEYLWKAAYCFHVEESSEAEAWVKERALKVLMGDAVQVAAGIRRSATKRGLQSKERKNADACSDYLLRKKDYLRYDKALRSGYPIATGVIEGACRYLVKDRMDITGARWGLKGAEAVLKIRALVTSGDFEKYFEFHKQKERARNYPFYETISFKMAA
jgi:hypothetical protein